MWRGRPTEHKRAPGLEVKTPSGVEAAKDARPVRDAAGAAAHLPRRPEPAQPRPGGVRAAPPSPRSLR